MAKLNLRCAICGKVEESLQDTDELENVEADDICPHCFFCKECSEIYDAVVANEALPHG